MRLLFAAPIALVGPCSYASSDLANSFTLDGRLTLVESEEPLLDPNVRLLIQILDPSKQCVLYEEEQSVNTQNSNGYYNIQVGSLVGSPKRTGNDPGHSMSQVFQNVAPLTAKEAEDENCPYGIYTPVIGDIRYLRLFVTPSSTGFPDLLFPDTVIDSVPRALIAETLQGKTADEFIQVGTGDLTQSYLQSVFASGNSSKLLSLLSVDPGNYVVKDSTNGTLTIPEVSTPPSPKPGEIWFESGTLKFWDGASEKTLTIAGSGVSEVTAGTGLRVGAALGGTITSSGTLNVDVGTNEG